LSTLPNLGKKLKQFLQHQKLKRCKKPICSLAIISSSKNERDFYVLEHPAPCLYPQYHTPTPQYPLKCIENRAHFATNQNKNSVSHQRSQVLNSCFLIILVTFNHIKSVIFYSLLYWLNNSPPCSTSLPAAHRGL
jgi:hypothetical protein